MKSFYIKQKLISLTENFHVYDTQENPVYTIEGNFNPVRKTYTILDTEQQERALIERKLLSLLPKFEVQVENSYTFTVKKKLSLLKSRFTIEGEGVEVRGNIFDMDFTVYHKNQEIGLVEKEWIALGDTYHIQVFDEAWEMIILTLVVAIDRAKEERWNMSTWIDF